MKIITIHTINDEPYLSFSRAQFIMKNQGHFYYNGQFFRVVPLDTPEFMPCDWCKLDSICRPDIASICKQFDEHLSAHCILKLSTEE